MQRGQHFRASSEHGLTIGAFGVIPDGDPLAYEPASTSIEPPEACRGLAASRGRKSIRLALTKASGPLRRR